MGGASGNERGLQLKRNEAVPFLEQCENHVWGWMKIGILSNCQHLGLANSIRALRPAIQVISFEIVLVALQGREIPTMEALGTCDVVIVDPSPGCPPTLSEEKLKSGTKVLKIPPVLFSGYHPDTIYISTAIGRLQVPAACGPYQSRLTVASYLLGYSPDETRALFNTFIFGELGYFEEYAKSRALLEKAFRECGLDIGPLFPGWAKRGCFMHSIDHPKIYVLFDIARLACQAMGLEVDPRDGRIEMILDNLMAGHPAMPVYPDIAHATGCDGHTMFKCPSDPNVVRLMRMPAFINACFKAYAEVPKDILFGGDGVEAAVRTLRDNEPRWRVNGTEKK